MPTQPTPSTPSSNAYAHGANGHSTPQEIFALTDEQILEIDPEPQDVQVVAVRPDAPDSASQSAAPIAAENAPAAPPATGASDNPPSPAAPAVAAPFSSPEDLRAVAELYPGGVTQAKSAAQRARALDEFDSAYFGAPGSSPDQISSSRAQLAQRLLNENPAAFREMVFAGLRALEELNALSSQQNSRLNSGMKNIPPAASPVSAEHPAPSMSREPAPALHAPHLDAYAVFEKAANADLEKSVGGAIDRALQQALPTLGKREVSGGVGAQHGAPLQSRLSAAIRQDVELALQGDRQLGEQIAQILAAHRFDDATRVQVVRLINDRAQQLVPVAAKRALNDWTQATLAEHRARTRNAEAASSRREVPAAASAAHSSAHNEPPRSAQTASRPASRNRLDYSRLSDDQILDL